MLPIHTKTTSKPPTPIGPAENRFQQPRPGSLGKFAKIVAAGHHRPGGAQMRGMARLEGMPRQHRHRRIRRQRLQRRHHQQPHRPRANHQDPLARLRLGPEHRVDAAGERLDHHGPSVAHRVMHADQLRLVCHELLTPASAQRPRGADEHARWQRAVREVIAAGMVPGSTGGTGGDTARGSQQSSGLTITRSPTPKLRTAVPQASIVPTFSCPMTNGNDENGDVDWAGFEPDDGEVAAADAAQSRADAHPVLVGKIRRSDVGVASAGVCPDKPRVRKRGRPPASQGKSGWAPRN